MIEYLLVGTMGFALGWIIAIIVGYHYGRKDALNEAVGWVRDQWS